MNISVITVCFNEEDNIGPCLDSIMQQDYRDGTIEIVVADGNSKDRTHEIVREYIKKNPDIKLVIEPKKGTAAGRNAGVKAAQFDHIAFIDTDCEAPENWLSILVNNYKELREKDNAVIAVGGANITDASKGLFIKAIEIALDSYLGSFSSPQGRQFNEIKYVDSLANLNVLYDKSKVVEIGIYDETLVDEAEDADLNYRLHKAGYKFVFLPDSYVLHKMRPSPRSWTKNMFRYGKGRARLLKRYPEMWNIAFSLPLLFALGLLSSILAVIHYIFLLPLMYFPILLIFSLFQSTRKKYPQLWFHVALVYVIQHFGYACGEIYGLLNPKVR